MIYKQKKKIEWKTIGYLCVTLFFIVLPMLMKALFKISSDVDVNVWEGFVNGEVCMYAISLLAPIWYAVETLSPLQKNTNNSKGGVWIPIFMIVASIIYGYLFFVSLLNVDIVKLKSGVAIFISIIALLLAIFIAYAVHTNEIIVSDPNQDREKQEEVMKKNIENLERGKILKKQKRGIEGELDIIDEVRDEDIEDDI